LLAFNQYVDFLDPDKKRFVIYAIPGAGLRPASSIIHFVPGSSLLYGLFGIKDGERGTGIRSFAVDETGVIRHAIRSSSNAPSRDEYAQWQLLQ
jgi:hypothetical protein